MTFNCNGKGKIEWVSSFVTDSPEEIVVQFICKYFSVCLWLWNPVMDALNFTLLPSHGSRAQAFWDAALYWIRPPLVHMPQDYLQLLAAGLQYYRQETSSALPGVDRPMVWTNDLSAIVLPQSKMQPLVSHKQGAPSSRDLCQYLHVSSRLHLKWSTH